MVGTVANWTARAHQHDHQARVICRIFTIILQIAQKIEEIFFWYSKSI